MAREGKRSITVLVTQEVFSEMEDWIGPDSSLMSKQVYLSALVKKHLDLLDRETQRFDAWAPCPDNK